MKKLLLSIIAFVILFGIILPVPSANAADPRLSFGFDFSKSEITVKPGIPIELFIRDIGQNKAYQLIIGSGDGSIDWYTLDIPKMKDDCKDPTAQNYDTFKPNFGVERWCNKVETGPWYNKDIKLNYYVSIDTTNLVCNTSALNPQGKCSIRLAESGDQVFAAANTLYFKTEADSNVTISSDNTEIATGGTATLTIEHLKPNTGYVVSVEFPNAPETSPQLDSNGLPLYYNIKINPGNPAISGCTVPSPQGKILWSGGDSYCKYIPSTADFTYRLSLGTKPLVCPGDTCSVHVRLDDSSSSKSFLNLASTNIALKATSLTLQPETTPYANVPVTFTATGCENEEPVKFIWWWGTDIPRACINTGTAACTTDGSDDDVDNNPATSNTEKKASIIKKFENTGDYAMQAQCVNSSKVAFTRFTVKPAGDDEANISISPIPLNPEQGYNIVLKGMDPDHCYYVRIQNPDGNFSAELNPLTEVDNSVCKGLSDKPYLFGNKFSNGEFTSEELPGFDHAGPYSFYLIKAVPRTRLKTVVRNAAPIIGAGLGASTAFIPGVGWVVAAPLGVAGAKIGDTIARGVASIEDELLDIETICVGGDEEDEIVDCSKLPDPPLPPCQKGYVGTKDNVITAPVLPQNPTDADIELYRKNLKVFRDQIDGCLTVDTGLGSISTDPIGLIRSVMAILLSLSGGIALLLIIISGYKLMTSRGDPEKIQAAKDRLTSAIIGLLFIIFSLVIVEVIGVDILAIPGLGR